MLSLMLALATQDPTENPSTQATGPTPPAVSAFQIACVGAGGAIGALNLPPPQHPSSDPNWRVPLYDGPLAQVTVSLRATVTGQLQELNGTNPNWVANLYDSYGRTVERAGPIYLSLNRPSDRPIIAEWCVFVRPALR